MRVREKPTTEERPPLEWLNSVIFKEEPQLVTAEEGVFLHGYDGEPSHFRWGWIWFPSENKINHGVHIDFFGSYWKTKVWGPLRHGAKLTLPRKPTDEEVRTLLRLVWCDYYTEQDRLDGW